MHERAQAGRNGGIVGRSETGCECGRHIAQEVISPRSGAEMQQQPRSLQIWHIRDAGEKTLLRFPLGSEDCVLSTNMKGSVLFLSLLLCCRQAGRKKGRNE